MLSRIGTVRGMARLIFDLDRVGERFPDRLLSATEETWADAPEGGWSVELLWADIDGRVECVGLAVVGEGSKPLTASVLRQLPLGSVITEGRRAQMRRANAMAGPVLTDLSPADLEALRGDAAERVSGLTARRRRYEPEHYQQVAAAYDEAIAAGIPPTAHVQQTLGLRTRSQAAKQVARARERGLLPPTTQRVPKGNADD